MGYSSVQIKGKTVVKSSDPLRMQIEVEKSRRAYSIGEKSGLFYVPAICDYDKKRGIAVFERIEGIIPVEHALHDETHRSAIIEQIGGALAVIHRELILPDEMRIELPADFGAAGSDVFIHGDFNSSNVCLRQGEPSLVILDWQTTHHHGGEATYGSRFFDLVWFVNYLIWTAQLKDLFYNPLNVISKHLMDAYLRASAYSCLPDTIFEYFENFFQAKLHSVNGYVSSKRQMLGRLLIKSYLKSLQSKTHDEIR